jgi:hypothetical protein
MVTVEFFALKWKLTFDNDYKRNLLERNEVA